MLLEIFILLSGMAAAFSFLSFFRTAEMRVFFAVLAAIIWFIIGLAPLNITLFNAPGDVFINNSNVTSSTIGGGNGTVNWRSDTPLSYLFMGLGIVMLVRTVQLILEWWHESKQPAEEPHPMEVKEEEVPELP